jgi:threonyl-tRNA synthetase
MALNKEDLTVLKILVEKELEHIEKDQEKLVIVNAPFITKVAGDDSDLNFLKSIEKYKEFLQELNKRL